MRDLLLMVDKHHTDLALDLMDRFEKLTGDSCSWDPDAYYTPLEHDLHLIAKECGIDYSKEIVAENYRRSKERKR